jgi:hypothetical protein
MVASSPDGWTFYAIGDVRRGRVSGSDQYLCLGAGRRDIDTTVDPWVMTEVHESTCDVRPGNAWTHSVDSRRWESTINGSHPTRWTKTTWVRNERARSWEQTSLEDRETHADFTLDWRGTSNPPEPLVFGVPVCITYSPLMPVYPCPSTRVGSGATRAAEVDGSLSLSGIDATFNLDSTTTHIFRPELAISWAT